MHSGNGTHRELDAVVVELFDRAMDDARMPHWDWDGPVPG